MRQTGACGRAGPRKCRARSETSARDGFKDYVSFFFPVFLHCHLNKRVVQDLVSTHTSGFLDGIITVEISTRAAFDLMVLHANVFQRGTRELLRQSRLMAGTESNVNSNLVVLDSLPIGILGLSQSETRKICSDHIDAMITALSYAEHVCAGDHTSLAFQLLKIMQKYAKTVSSRTIIHPDHIPSSRLLSRLIKQIVHKLRGDEAECFEERDSVKACRELEDVPFAQCKSLLHKIYPSNKEFAGGTRDAGFNPHKSFFLW
ncbi:uncharacterized protein RAG0_01067 [Rhynchosporium agropyri]|uniref:Uncharacterized protein n=1 Tax=Rhynchosporium agropyri TaxID=914238 RepID=A0A1E1JVG6_9HELO|nr:uncharacterized protein RAG0_01067 [Rhynchosporium agropyri]